MSVESVIARARRIVEPSAASQDEKEKIAGLALDLINRETAEVPGDTGGCARGLALKGHMAV